MHSENDELLTGLEDQRILDPLKVDYYNVKKAALILNSLNHPLRQQIISFISEKNKVTVTEIYIKLRMEQSVASQHLSKLRRSGIVITEKEGKFVYYMINHTRIKSLGDSAKDILG